MYHGSSLPKTNFKGIVGAGLAIEFAHSPGDVETILKPGDPCLSAQRTTLIQQQYLDLVFIILYWAFFFFSFAGPLRSSANEKRRQVGRWIRVLITMAAALDVVEDYG